MYKETIYGEGTVAYLPSLILFVFAKKICLNQTNHIKCVLSHLQYPSTTPHISPPQASTPVSLSTVDGYFSALSPSYSVSGESFNSSFERLSLNCPAPMYKPPPAHNLRQPTE